MKTVLLLGYQGYIGWGLIQRLIKENYKIVAVDNSLRKDAVEKEMTSYSATPISSVQDRDKFLNKLSGKVHTYHFDYVLDEESFENLFKSYSFDTIVNLAHIPSAGYSQISKDTANYTLANNYLGTNVILWNIRKYCPEAQYITIGSTGEFDHNLDIPIEEGYFTLPGASKDSIFPRRTNSIYHCSKIASTYLIDTLARMWKIKCTDIQQAVVFGAFTDEIDISKEYSRFDTDDCFGTVCNRFCLQAVLGQDLLVYGKGEHNRGFLTLNDSIQALMIAIKNDTEKDFKEDFSPRVWNQLSFWTSINDLATKVQEIAKEKFDIEVGIEHIPTPRNEVTDKPKFYSYETKILESYGYSPTRTLEEEIEYVLNILVENKENLIGLRKNTKNLIEFK